MIRNRLNIILLMPRRNKASRVRPNRAHGFTLIEGVISLVILSTTSALLFSVFSFSFRTQTEIRTQLEACRSAGQILEIFRTTSFNSLTAVEYGNLNVDPLNQFQQKVITDLQDRLQRQNLSMYMTIRPYLGRAKMKYMSIVIASSGLDPTMPFEEVPTGKTLVKQATLVAQGGITP